MTKGQWLFVPSTASDCAPVSGDWNSGCTSPSPDIAVWVTSSGTLAPRPFSWSGWSTRPYLRRLSSTICDPSTADRGVEAWISSLRATRASHSARLAGSVGRTTLATSGPRWLGSLTKSDPDAWSWRTSKATSGSASGRSAPTWSGWVSGLQRAYSERSKRARRSFGLDCSLWPTPTASGHGQRSSIELAPAAFKWRKENSQEQLSQVAATVFWVRRMIRALGLNPGDQVRGRTDLPGSFPPTRLILQSWSVSSSPIPRLNPRFVEWLMGLPAGWTDASSSVMGFSRWERRMRTALSMMLWRDGANWLSCTYWTPGAFESKSTSDRCSSDANQTWLSKPEPN